MVQAKPAQSRTWQQSGCCAIHWILGLWTVFKTLQKQKRAALSGGEDAPMISTTLGRSSDLPSFSLQGKNKDISPHL